MTSRIPRMTAGYTHSANRRVYMTTSCPVPLDTDASRTNGRTRRTHASLSQSPRKNAFGNEREEDSESRDRGLLLQTSVVSFWLALFNGQRADRAHSDTPAPSIPVHTFTFSPTLPSPQASRFHPVTLNPSAHRPSSRLCSSSRRLVQPYRKAIH